MSVVGAELERIGAREFFGREYLLEDIRWMVARLLGTGGSASDTGGASQWRVARATA